MITKSNETLQYDQYTSITDQAGVSRSDVPSIPSSVDKAPPAQESDKPSESKAAGVSDKPAPPVAGKVIGQEEKVEYRDQDGNILNEEQVKELQGKVKFETKYETRTRVVDDSGNELPVPEGGWPADIAGVAPPHPDVQGVDRETVKDKKVDPPKDAAASRDGEKESEWSKAKPASEGKEATVRDEL